jgi:tRNA nucleotidyltransferase (CCA-adding enzyme)
LENTHYPQSNVVRAFAKQSATLDVQAIIKAGHKGPEIKRELAQQRLTIIQNIIEQHRAERNNG